MYFCRSCEYFCKEKMCNKCSKDCRKIGDIQVRIVEEMKAKILKYVQNELDIEVKLSKPLPGTMFCYRCRTFGKSDVCEKCNAMTHDAMFEHYAEKIMEMVIRGHWRGECVCEYGSICSKCGDFYCSRENRNYRFCDECGG